MYLYQVRKGLEILSRYNRETSTVASDGQRLFAGNSHPDVLSKFDREGLDELRWRWDDKLTCWYINL